MTPKIPTTPDRSALAAAAAQWIVRRDRGLSANEAIEFELWLAADPRHAAALRQSEGAWTLLDRTPEITAQRELATATCRRTRWRRGIAIGSLAAAAALVLAGYFRWQGTDPLAPASPGLRAAGPRAVTLADGTLVRLNAGGELVEEFTASERRVRLARGEAHFTVMKDSTRPFVVNVGSLRVRAVGTAFNILLRSSRVEVLVTEGQVQLATDATSLPPPPLLEAGQRAVVSSGEASFGAGAAPAIVVTRVDPTEMTRALAWHQSVVRLGGATLAELAAELERRFGQRVVIADPEIAELRAGGRLRADDADGAANVLATTFDLEVERAADGAWVLRKKKRESR